jgi:hypothetical protein
MTRPPLNDRLKRSGSSNVEHGRPESAVRRGLSPVGA